MSSAAAIITGGCAVWPLPHTRKCAWVARNRVRAALADLLPERLDDCLTMVSELATNAWLHGLGGKELDGRDAPAAGRSELAIYRRGPQDNAELVVTVFDPSSDLTAISDPAPTVLAEAPDKSLNESPSPEVLADLLERLPDKPAEELLTPVADLPPQWWSGNRGLANVRALSGGRWGFRRARSRLGAERVSGKVVWFAVRIPAGELAARPPKISLSPAAAAKALESELAVRGVRGVMRSFSDGLSVISAPGVTIWCRAEGFSLDSIDHSVQLPITDFVEAVEQIIEITEDRRHITSLQLPRIDEAATASSPPTPEWSSLESS